MVETGEGVDASITVSGSPKPGSLVVIVAERMSNEPVSEVEVCIIGPTGGTSTTDKQGTVRFSGLTHGRYIVQLRQDEFEMHPNQVITSVVSGEEENLEITVGRVILTVVMKRIHPRGRMRAVVGDKSNLEYGHWWVVIDGSESYGWWPGRPVGMTETFTGIPGSLNGQTTPQWGGTPTRDPDHYKHGDEMFNPSVESGQTAAEIKNGIRSFANGYSGNWSWPWGQNCHSFQESMMEHGHLSKSSSKKVE